MRDDSQTDFGATYISGGTEQEAVEESGFILSPSSQELPLAPDAELPPGTSIGKFEVVDLLGRGGMGTVYRAHDPDIDRDVAIKLMSAAFAANEPARKRFQAEGRAAGQLAHPNVVAIYDVGVFNNLPYLVMEYVTGGSVEELVADGRRVDPQRATEILADACAGLAAAHMAGLVHRDVKPANLMIDADGTVKVADFGLARAPQSGDPRLTQASRIVGTPFFMSPEQCSGHELDARSDIYSLGATYFALLTGVSPFESAGSMMDILAAHLHEETPQVHHSVPDAPQACTRLIERAMAKSPDDRYPSADDLLIDAEALAEMLADPRSSDKTTYRGVTTCARDSFVLPSEDAESERKRQVSQARATSAKRSGGSSIIASLTSARKSKRKTQSSPRASSTDTKVDSHDSTNESKTKQPPGTIVADTHDRLPTMTSAAAPTQLPSIANPIDPDVRREVYNVSGGEFVLLGPKHVPESEVPELIAWMDLLIRKIKRDAQASSDPKTSAKQQPKAAKTTPPPADEPCRTIEMDIDPDRLEKR